MKLQATRSQETFDAELTTEHPATIPGPIALKRLDTGTFIALREILGILDAQYQPLQASAAERNRLKEVGITIAETAEDLQDWYRNWNGPK